jgi:hypothetical protein
MSQELVKTVRADPNFKKFLKLVENITAKIDTEAISREALGLHSSRLSRSLHGEARYSPTALIDANIQDLSFRARLVELRVTLGRKLDKLDEVMAAIKRHISTEYDDELRDFATVDQRKAFVTRTIKRQHAILADGNSVISMIDLLIKDIDQASHSMRHSLDCLKLLATTSGKVV